MALVIRTDSWSTMRPAPMFWWPTSLLPIVPSGRPTSNPLVWINTLGYSAISRSATGCFARYTALEEFHFGSGFFPQPSRTIRTSGRLAGLDTDVLSIRQAGHGSGEDATGHLSPLTRRTYYPRTPVVTRGAARASD